MEQWAHTPGSTGGFGASPPISPSSAQQDSAAAWALGPIMQALARLEMGQVLNRKAGDARVADLRAHMSEQMTAMRGEIHDRVDRLEDRVLTVERSVASTTVPTPAAPPSPPPIPLQPAVASPSTTPPPPASPPWWSQIGPREWIFYLFALLTVAGVIPLEVLERLIKSLVLLPLGSK